MQKQNLDLMRAQKAHEITEGVDKDKKEYKSSVQKMPMLIYNNGLAAALMAVQNDKIFDAVVIWLQCYQKEYQVFSCTFIDKAKVVENIIGLDSDQYRLATMEILAFFTWMKRCVGAWDIK